MKLSSSRDVKCLIALLLAAVALNLASCGKAGDRFSSQTYRIPWPNDVGDVSLQNVEIRTLTNPEHFEGSTARILVEPSDGGGRLSGERPVGHFVRTSAGPIIPADFITMQAITAYAHQERLHDLDQKAGAADYLSWPLSLGIEVHVLSSSGPITNNAIYDAKLNSLLLVPYTEGDLPMALSPGILGHEHFHFIFQNIVMSRVKDVGTQTTCSGAAPASPPAEKKDVPSGPVAAKKPIPDFIYVAGSSPCSRLLDDQQALTCHQTAQGISKRVFNAFLLRAMNEGFADFWGWLYSHDEFFIAKSLPSEMNSRRLDWGSGRLPTEQLNRENLVDLDHPEKVLGEDGRTHSAYVLGSQYARFLRQSVADLVKETGVSEADAGLAIARALIQSLPALSDLVAANYETEFFSPNMMLKPLILNLPKVSSGFCSHLNHFHARETSYEKPRGCEAFKEDAETTSGFAGRPSPSVAPTATPAPIQVHLSPVKSGAQ